MEKRTLLQKYEIPISHLDFDYVNKCKNAKELERIVAILRSGEEGFYPDLTKCAEEKLRELKPQSRALRTEERLLTKHSLSSKDWKEHKAPISEWSTDIKNKDTLLSKIQEDSETGFEIQLPPVRKGGKVGTKKIKELSVEKKAKDTPPPAATNYSQWDKYDADAEILKMDLDEERANEIIERKNKLNQKKSAGIEVIDGNKSKVYEKLSPIERQKLSEDYKIRGNEYFKSKEYTSALENYSRCIEIQPTVAGYNNRAIANLKMQGYENALSDCNECLKLDAFNLKALLRKAEAFLGLEKKVDALKTYEKIQLIEPTNAIASKALERLRKELGEVAPTHATRLQIMENDVPTTMQSKPGVDYDLADLIKPNKIVKNNLMKTMEHFQKLPSKKGVKSKNINDNRAQRSELLNAKPEIRLQINDHHPKPQGQRHKLLIEEL